MSVPLVSIITPTHGRERFLPLIYSCFNHQDWTNLEWLVDDDNSEGSEFMKNLADNRVKYYHHPARRSVGAKRNYLIEHASGEYIVHFDDDDYYAPRYISHYVSFMLTARVDCVKLTGFFIYDEVSSTSFYWDQAQSAGPHFVCKKDQPRRTIQFNSNDDQELRKFQLGYGFSYAYRRSMWECINFQDLDFCEDLLFMAEAVRTGSVAFLQDTSGLCLHVIHATNISGCFPQYKLPEFMIRSLFPQATVYFNGPAGQS